jgi:DNA-binding MarR family transcriptional regulator
LNEDLHPYVVFLPSEQKTKILSAIFGSRAAVDILEFSLSHGISGKIYQKDLVSKLAYSNKTIIKNLKSLTKLGVLMEDMEKSERDRRTVWVKAYQLSDAGKWFALLLAKEKDLSKTEKAEILQNLFKMYIRWVKSLSEKLHVERETLKDIFTEEMESAEETS